MMKTPWSRAWAPSSPSPADWRGSLLFAGGLGGLMLLTGCTVGPNYEEPHSSLATGFADASVSRNKPPTGRIVPVEDAPERWWAVFEDPELNSLVERALQNNRDLKQA